MGGWYPDHGQIIGSELERSCGDRLATFVIDK